MSIGEIREELIENIQYNLSTLLVEAPIHNSGVELEETGSWLQALGICNLLLYADTDRFYENLVRSGHTRRYFLRKSHEEGNYGDFRLAISRWESFLDTVAAGDFDLAGEIVALSPLNWIPDGEYEDDFLYYVFLHRFTTSAGPDRPALLRSALERLEAWLDGQPSIRFRLCRALNDNNVSAFEEAFEDFIAYRQEQIARERRMALAADITFEPRTHIFIEGLALLRLARRAGFMLAAEYAYCPSIAQRAPKQPYPEDIFPLIEQERGQVPLE